MHVRWLKIGDSRREVLSTQFSHKFITPSVHLCLQYVLCDAARRAVRVCQRQLILVLLLQLWLVGSSSSFRNQQNILSELFVT